MLSEIPTQLMDGRPARRQRSNALTPQGQVEAECYVEVRHGGLRYSADLGAHPLLDGDGSDMFGLCLGVLAQPGFVGPGHSPQAAYSGPGPTNRISGQSTFCTFQGSSLSIQDQDRIEDAHSTSWRCSHS